jgi:hypothetical protein
MVERLPQFTAERSLYVRGRVYSGMKQSLPTSVDSVEPQWAEGCAVLLLMALINPEIVVLELFLGAIDTFCEHGLA